MNNPDKTRPRWLVPAILTLVLIAARLAAVPALTNPTGVPVSPAYTLQAPVFYLLLGPLFSTWDAITLLSMERLKGFLWGLGLIYLVWRVTLGLRRRSSALVPRLLREVGVLAVSLLALALFVLVGMIWHRPMIGLRGAATDQLVADLHSHTNVSHDVRGTLMRGYDVEASRRWHARAGFDAFYVTDHNTTAGWKGDSSASRSIPFACPGIEVSAWRAHIVLLGDTADVKQSDYDGSLAKVLNLLRDSRPRFGALAIASLPEYNRAFWPVIDSLVDAGVAGFEIVNASPKAADFPLAHRDSIIRTARDHHLLLAGVSDSHGWGATSLSWMVIELPGWRALPNPCPALLDKLGRGNGGVTILERHHLTPESAWPRLLTPFGALWEEWRSMTTTVLLSWLAWTWLVALFAAKASKK